MTKQEKVINGMERCIKRMTTTGECGYDCPYYHHPLGCKVVMLKDAIFSMKAQDTTMLQGFLADIRSSESILNSVNCHAISLEDASRIIAICACACDVMSSSGFIRCLKERMAQDVILKGCVEE